MREVEGKRGGAVNVEFQGTAREKGKEDVCLVGLNVVPW